MRAGKEPYTGKARKRGPRASRSLTSSSYIPGRVRINYIRSPSADTVKVELVTRRAIEDVSLTPPRLKQRT